MHFKSDFYRMRLLGGGKEVEPIHPAKVEHRVAVRNSAVNVNDATYEGFYTFSPLRDRAHCGTVALQLFTEKEPEKGETKTPSPRSFKGSGMTSFHTLLRIGLGVGGQNLVALAQPANR